MMYVSQKQLLLERLLSRLDKTYSKHYQQFISKVSNKIDLLVDDIKKNQISEKSVTIVVTVISFQDEFSCFFKWATHYKPYRFHFFLGYNDIEQLLLNKCEKVEWIDNYTVHLTINLK